MSKVLEPLLASPELPRYVQELREILARENQLRQQFYAETTEQQKAEFINGKVVLQAPTQLRHSVASDFLFVLLSMYADLHDLGWVGHEKLLVTLTRNDYEPDVSFWRHEKAAGFTDDQMKFPAPDFIAEVLSPSTEKNDRGIKFEDYAAHGVREYWIVDPRKELVEKFVLKGKRLVSAGTVRKGYISSETLAGCVFPVAAIFHRPANLAALKRWLAEDTYV